MAAPLFMPSELWDSFKLTDHTSSMFTLAGHPFLPMLVSGSFDKTVRLWDLETRRCVCTLEGHTSIVVAVAFNSNGRRLASGSWDRSINLWDLDSATKSCPVQTFRDRTMRTVRALTWNPSSTLVASGSDDVYVRVWDTASESLLYTLKGHSGSVRAVMSHPTDDLFASASGDTTVCVWHWSTGESVHTLRGHTEHVTSLVVSSSFIVSGSRDKTVRVWSWTSGLCVRVLKGFAAPLDVHSLAWRDSTLVVHEPRGTIHMWDTSSDEDPTKWSCVKSIPSLTKSSWGMVIASGGQIASVDADDNKRIEVWAVDLADDD